jgi:signal transduction histidine kinase
VRVSEPDCEVSQRVSVSGDALALPPGVDLAAYRLVWEALTNALKHADTAHRA